MNNLIYLFEEILNENPNQAIKFLKDKKLDPSTNPKGKNIIDNINNITKGDGYTYLLTKFHINERMPFDELEHLHEKLKSEKNVLTRLPKPVVNYDTYRELANDISRLLSNMNLSWLLKQLSPELRNQANILDTRSISKLTKISENFRKIETNKQRHFMKKVFGFKDIHQLINNLQLYINEVNNEEDYESLKVKIDSTPDAYIVYDNPEGDILIAHIDSMEAMEKLACTSAWCISKDRARYRQYKTGGKYYFLIWDYNYPKNNQEFFIATAYNSENPARSSTHEHIEDKPLYLNNVIESKKLNYDIFNKYIKDFKEKRKQEYEATGGIILALKNDDTDTLIDMILESKFLSPYDPHPYAYRYDDEIELGITRKQLIELFELGEDFNYIESTANDHYGGNDSADSDEANYMHTGLNDENKKLLIKLAQMSGESKSTYKYFNTKEGKIKSFLELYNMDDLISTYLSEFGDAQSEAEKQAAKELIDKFPFETDKPSFKSKTLFEYYINNELTAKNFDELITQIKNNLPEFSWDSISDARYSDLDLDELNRTFNYELEKIIDDIELDEDSVYYQQAKMISDARKYLEKIGFVFYPENNHKIIALLKKAGLYIEITDLEKTEDINGNPQIMASAAIKNYEKQKQHWKTINIKVPITSLKNYIYQYSLPLEEQLYRRIRDIIFQKIKK